MVGMENLQCGINSSLSPAWLFCQEQLSRSSLPSAKLFAIIAVMKKSSNPQELNFRFARQLDEVAQLLESQGANPYRPLTSAP